MAEDIGYEFDRVHLQNAIYRPIAHGQMNLDNQKFVKDWLQSSQVKVP